MNPFPKDALRDEIHGLHQALRGEVPDLPRLTAHLQTLSMWVAYIKGHGAHKDDEDVKKLVMGIEQTARIFDDPTIQKLAKDVVTEITGLQW